MNLAGLGYLAGGAATGMDEGERRRALALQSAQLRQQNAGQGDAGAAIMRANGVTPPTTQPQGGLLAQIGAGVQKLLTQPSQGPAGGQAQPPQGQPAQPQPQPAQQQQPPPQFQAAAQKLDFPTLTRQLAQMPGMTPQRLMGALAALQPYMNLQSQMDYKNAMLSISQQRANTGAANEASEAQYRNSMAKAAGERANTGAANVQSEIQNRQSLQEDRAQRRSIDQQKLALAQKTQERMQQSVAQKDTLGAETNLRGLLAQRTQALTAAAGDATDPTVQMIDSMIAEARHDVETLRAQPAQHQTWEGKGEGRAEPEVAKPTGTPAPAPQGMSDADKAASLANAKAAIAKGYPKDKVIERLKAAGIDPTGL